MNVIPIIARADEFTINQLESIKGALRDLVSKRTVLDPRSFTQSYSPVDEGYRSIGRMAAGVQSDSELDPETTEENVPVTPIIRSRSNSVHGQAFKKRNKRFSEIASKPSEDDIDRIFPVSLIIPESFDIPSFQTKSNFLDIKDPSTTTQSRFERKFRYGTVDVENEDHCEFTGLKRVLFTTGWKTLKENTEDIFEEFRTERLQMRQARSRAATSSSE